MINNQVFICWHVQYVISYQMLLSLTLWGIPAYFTIILEMVGRFKMIPIKFVLHLGLERHIQLFYELHL